MGRIKRVPTIFNESLVLADTEYDVVLPATCNEFSVKNVGTVAIRMAFETGKAVADGPYLTLAAGESYTNSPGWDSSHTIYLATDGTNVPVEVLAWSDE